MREIAAIALNVSISPNLRDHFVVRFDQPGRVEVILTKKGDLIANVYGGSADDLEQEPEGCYDSTGKNASWESDVDEWTLAMWRHDAENGDTHLDYWSWVRTRRNGQYEE